MEGRRLRVLLGQVAPFGFDVKETAETRLKSQNLVNSMHCPW